MRENDDLIRAVREKRAGDAQDALTAGADPNATDIDGRPALLIAVEQDDTAVADVLLSHGATPNAQWQPPPRAPDAAVLNMLADQPAIARDAYIRSCQEPDLVDVYWTCLSADMARRLVRGGLNPAGFDLYVEDDCLFPAAVGADRIAPRAVDKATFRAHANPRRGRANPEPHLPDFWSEQIRTCKAGFAAETMVIGEAGTTPGPVWSFARFGRSATRLPDGSWLLIAGEHEDHYDPDFAIYADATVISPDGKVQHFIYPDEVFPPTDFHSANLIDGTLWLIGSLGYPARRGDSCQVLSMDIQTFSVTGHTTTGDDPGWIHRHHATHSGDCIRVFGGKSEPGHQDRTEVHILDIKTLSWSRA
ncbi:MAG: hypothetical protein AAGK37_00100 [Pseudomonadota bacterium]